MDSVNGPVLVCSETLGERRKLLGHFSRQGVPVSLCATPAFAIDSLDHDTALVVVNLYDCAWPVEKWQAAIAQETNGVPVLFVHAETAEAGSASGARAADALMPPQLHLTEGEFHSLADAEVSDLRTRIFAVPTNRWNTPT